MNTLTPNLMVENVNKTVKFYKKIFGFEVVQTVPKGGELEWAEIKCGNVRLMFQSRESLSSDISEFKKSKLGGTLTFFIKLNDIEEFYKRIKNKAEIIQDLHTTSYGMKEFSVRDCNGYILALAEEK